MDHSLSIREAADRLGITDQAVHKRIKNGSLDAVKINKHWFVSESSVEYALVNVPKLGRPRRGDEYTLMNGPYPVMAFVYREEKGSFAPREVIDASRAPIGTVGRNGQAKAEGLRQWWSHRAIPESRDGLDAKLLKLGIDEPAQIPFRNLGLSLSDQYWICPAGESLAWEDLNYFQNEFECPDSANWDEWLSGVGLSTPDNTSEGVLPKKWVCRSGRRLLLKGHVPWTDQQAYNEAVASLLFERVLDGCDFVPYWTECAGQLGVVSVCECFVSTDEEYVPASLIYDSEGKRRGESEFDAVVRMSVNLGIPRREVETFLSKMIVCDSVLANTDRHLRNFGYLRNIHTLRWRFAPLFDSGNSLWYDKDESAVARGDYSFVSRPFDGNPNRQLLLAQRLEWLDPSDLDGFVEEAIAMLEKGDIVQWRLDYLREGLKRRVAAVKEICFL